MKRNDSFLNLFPQCSKSYLVGLNKRNLVFLIFPKLLKKKSNRHSIQDVPGDLEQTSQEKGNKKIKANTVSGGRNKIRKILDKTRFSILPPKLFR